MARVYLFYSRPIPKAGQPADNEDSVFQAWTDEHERASQRNLNEMIQADAAEYSVVAQFESRSATISSMLQM